MAVPKEKISRARRNSRAANWKATAPALSECPQCGELKRNHFICAKCGYYDGVKKIETEKKSKEDK